MWVPRKRLKSMFSAEAMTGITEYVCMAARSSNLFHHASDFEILGGQYILGDVHTHHVGVSVITLIILSLLLILLVYSSLTLT
ncbi:hypothetical protein R3P38DRAFT_2891572 [Favolaschia claudopus]|uniref:Uncharacterized protein n=1 Tax=Favolaschia claudopus TaxID=2862362 RepID=A0AAW0CXI3_9AGAR